MCGCPGTRHSWEKEGNESSRPRILTQSSPWLFPAIKESSLTFKMLGGRIFFFSKLKVTWPDYFKHSWLFPHAPAPLAGTGVFSKLG